MTESSDRPSNTSSHYPGSATGTPETGWPTTPPWQPVTGEHPPYPYPYPGGGYPGGSPPPYYGFGHRPVGPRNGLGIASLVLAIVALLFVWSVLGGVILGVAATAVGVAAHARVRRGEANNGGVAIAGVVLGILAVVVGLIFILVWMGFWRDVGGGDYMDCLQNAGPDPGKQQQCAEQFRQQVENQLSITLTPQTPQPEPTP